MISRAWARMAKHAPLKYETSSYRPQFAGPFERATVYAISNDVAPHP